MKKEKPVWMGKRHCVRERKENSAHKHKTEYGGHDSKECTCIRSHANDSRRQTTIKASDAALLHMETAHGHMTNTNSPQNTKGHGDDL